MPFFYFTAVTVSRGTTSVDGVQNFQGLFANFLLPFKPAVDDCFGRTATHRLPPELAACPAQRLADAAARYLVGCNTSSR
jgi:hypothetical protein